MDKKKGTNMKKIKLNNTPVRTSRNFNINDIKLESIEVPENVQEFKNITITGETSKITMDSEVSDYKISYGLNELLTKQVKNNANKKLRFIIDSKIRKQIELDFWFDKKNQNLIENIEIIVNEGCKANIILKYKSEEKVNVYHNEIIKMFAKANSEINITIVNLLNTTANNFISIDNEIGENAKINYTIVDFGGAHSITNYYSNLIGESSDNSLNAIYLGKENQLFDLNYIGELRGKKSNINIEVQGALKDTAKKHFKGTIDFKKGCKKATGNENEACMLLSDTAKSIALPMLLCSEEDVEGNHSSSAGKIGEKELFYIMSRGFELKEAMKLMVRAKFNKILENIKNEDLKQEILDEIDKRLD